MKIKKDDNVIVLSGKDKGKTGKVTKAFPKENKVLVAGINMFKKSQRPTKQGQKGQTVEISVPMHASKVALAEKVKKESKKKK